MYTRTRLQTDTAICYDSLSNRLIFLLHDSPWWHVSNKSYQKATYGSSILYWSTGVSLYLLSLVTSLRFRGPSLAVEHGLGGYQVLRSFLDTDKFYPLSVSRGRVGRKQEPAASYCRCSSTRQQLPS